MKVPTHEIQDKLLEQMAKIDVEAAKLKSETDEGLDKVEAMVPEHDEAMFPEHDEVHVHERGYGCCDFAMGSPSGNHVAEGKPRMGPGTT